MGDTFRKVRDGEKLKIPARTYNAMVDAAQDFINRKSNVSSEAGNQLPANMLYIKNDSGANVDRFNVLGIAGSAILPSGSDGSNFFRSVVFSGVTPLLPDHRGGNFVVTAEPIANGSVGLGYISGVIQIKVYAPYAVLNGTFADIAHNDVTQLAVTNSPSTTKIMFRHNTIVGPSGNTYWAIVRLNYSENPIRRAVCKQAAGASNSIQVNLIRNNAEQTSGVESNVTVTCDIFGGEISLQNAMPKLQSGDIIYVTNVDGSWRCINTFTPFVSCECEDSV